MNSIIILLVISTLFLDVFFSVSNDCCSISRRKSCGWWRLGGQQEGVTNSSQEVSFEKSSTLEALSKVQEVSSSLGKRVASSAGPRSARKRFPKMSLDEFRERIMKC